MVRTRMNWLNIVISLTAVVVSCGGAEPVSLFDGKTLEGWKAFEGGEKYWSVVDGAIRGDSLGKKMTVNTYIFSEQSYDNFEFRCMIRLTGKPETGLVNSGIQFRSERHGRGAEGYQADVGLPNWWGSIYDEHRRGLIVQSDQTKLKPVLKPFDWNEYVIRAVGPRLKLFINGIKTADYVEQAPSVPWYGRFALQLHAGGICRIEYKDITVKPLAYKGPAGKQPSLADGDVMFDDFENVRYEGWTATGHAFGRAPLEIGTTPEYQGNLGATGRFCVNSHATAGSVFGAKNLIEVTQIRDKAIGKLTSKPFSITHDYIRFLIGGGNHVGRTCLNLLVDGKVVDSATGDANNLMQTKAFDARKYKGKTAQLQIVDAVSEGWGNIGVDEIVFTSKKPKSRPVQVRPARAPVASTRTKAWSPEKQLAGFKVPDGYVVELVASEADGIVNPIDMAFDDAGRLWSTTGRMYPMDPDPNMSWGEQLKIMDRPDLQMKDERFRHAKELYQGKRKGTDAVLVIDKLEGKPSKARVWAEGLAIPQSILPYKNGAFVAHGSEMIYLSDSNGDNKSDKFETVLTGFGFTDTHTMTHALVRAPGGWINYTQGALNKGKVTTVATGDTLKVDYCKMGRFALDGKGHELVGAGLQNIWGYSLRGDGQWFGTEANDLGWSVVPMELGSGYKGIGNERLRSYQPWFPAPHKFRVGATGISGLAFAEDESGGFPKEWQDVAFLANPLTQAVNAVRIVRRADGSVDAELLDDLLTSQDDWFRPVNIEFGPDGCLYVADFYNQIIGHNGVPRDLPARDKTHGRIWRIRYLGAKPPAIIDYTKVPTEELPQHLNAPLLWAKRAAWHQLVDREAKGMAAEVVAVCAAPLASKATKIAALWTLDGLDYYDSGLMQELLKSTDADVRREAIRALGGMPVAPRDLAELLRPFINQTEVMVRSQVLRTLHDYGKTSPELIDLAVSFCLPDSKSERLGGDYERKFERYLARVTLERYPTELSQYLDSAMANKQPAENLAWAQAALSLEGRAKSLLARWPSIKDAALSDDEFKAVCGLLRSPQVMAAATLIFHAANADYLVEMALNHHLEVGSPQLAELLKPVCQRLLTTGDPAKMHVAARATDLLEVGELEAQLAELLPTRLDDPIFVEAAAIALARKSDAFVDEFKLILTQAKVPATARLSAFSALARVDANAALQLAKPTVEALGSGIQPALAHRLAESEAGCRLALDLIDKKLIDPEIVDRWLAQRFAAVADGDPRAAAMVREQAQVRQRQATAAQVNIHAFSKITEEGQGNPAQGKIFFTAMCLTCHSAGGNGAGFAPALDGSGRRDIEDLLTAILDPDAAVEGNYNLYRVYKRDGVAVEGYVEEENSRGVKLRFMGGGELFVPRTEIATAGFVAGRSMMPTGLVDAFSNEQIADLLAYLRTLK